jgi:hypothetical protein
MDYNGQVNFQMILQPQLIPSLQSYIAQGTHCIMFPSYTRMLSLSYIFKLCAYYLSCHFSEVLT